MCSCNTWSPERIGNTWTPDTQETQSLHQMKKNTIIAAQDKAMLSGWELKRPTVFELRWMGSALTFFSPQGRWFPRLLHCTNPWQPIWCFRALCENGKLRGCASNIFLKCEGRISRFLNSAWGRTFKRRRHPSTGTRQDSFSLFSCV